MTGSKAGSPTASTTGAPALKIRLLGQFQVSVGGKPVSDTRWRRKHAKLLVKLLALSPQQQLHREQAMELLWPGSSPRSSANSLNKVLYMARRALEPELDSGNNSAYLARCGDTLSLQASQGIFIDVVHFESCAASAIRDRDPALLQQALDLYHADLLLDDPFEHFFEERRNSLANLHQGVLLSLSELAEQSGNTSLYLDYSQKLSQLDPVNEAYHRRLMRLYLQTAQRTRALAQFQRCTDIILRELDAQPEPATIKLYEQINSGSLPDTTDNPGISTDSTISADSRTLAVIPFENAGNFPELEYLCDGITEDLIYRLSRVSGLRVLASSTVFRFRSQSVDPVRVGRELNVDAVVVGRVRQSGNRLMLSVEQVDVADGTLIWGQQYDRDMSLILDLQADLSNDIWQQLKTSVEGAGPVDQHHRNSSSLDAYHQYLKGRYHWNKRNGSSLRKAQAYFASAIDLDPVYALAYAGLADTYNLMSLYTDALPHQSMPKARAAAQKALQLDPLLCEAHTSLAYCELSYDWDMQSAERRFGLALELDANYATAHQWYHKLLVANGRVEEADQRIQKALKLDPLSLMIATEKAWGLYHSRRYTLAIEHLHSLLAEEPVFPIAHYIMGLAQLQVGQPSQAIEELTIAIGQQQSSGPFLLGIGSLGHARAKAGLEVQANEPVARLLASQSTDAVSRYAAALVYAGLGECANSLKCLHHACDERYDRLIFLRYEPMFDVLREHPDYTRLLERFPHPPRQQLQKMLPVTDTA